MTLIRTLAVAPGEEPIHIVMTPEEEAAFIAGQAASQAASAISELKSIAQLALTKSDIQILRCMESGVSVPQAWAEYRTALRLIIKNGVGVIPAPPSYPEGT